MLILLGKLLLPSIASAVPRPRLLRDARILAVQAPAGCGKTTFLGQWLAAAGRPYLYYRLDELDRAPDAFARHLHSGLTRLWPDWAPPRGAESGPAALATELVNEAVVRPPLILALDGLEAAFGASYLTEFLTLLLRYGPPGLTLALSTRAPLPVELPDDALRITGPDLALSWDEAEAWLGPGDWSQCFTATGGMPGALACWRHAGPAWRAELAARTLSAIPAHVPPKVAGALVEEWLSGRMSLAEFTHQVSCGQPGAERVWEVVREQRRLLLTGQTAEFDRRLADLWEAARSSGDRALTGAVALLGGERRFRHGEFALALDWFRQAFEADPLLEAIGSHSVVPILLEMGRLDEAEGLARRCLEARLRRGDLQALAFGQIQIARVEEVRGRLAEAEAHFLEAERLALKLRVEPYFGILAKTYRAVLHGRRGDLSTYRRLAEEAVAMVITHAPSPLLEAYCGAFLGHAMAAWGERAEGIRLLAAAAASLQELGVRWHRYMVLALLATVLWRDAQEDEARAVFDTTLDLAVSEGYVQHLVDPWVGALPLIADALSRGSQVSFCQELLIRVGAAAGAPLTALSRHDDPEVRQRAVYPLAALGSGHQAPPTPAPHIWIELLGPLQLRVAGEPVLGWRTTKTRDLLAYLLLAGGRPVTRDQLLEALWPETEPESGQSALHTALYHLRRVLKPAGAELITFAGGAYRLDWSLVETDLARFRQLTAEGDESSWRSAVDLYRGDLLEGLDYPWLEGHRARVRTTYRECLTKLAAHLYESRRPAEAIPMLLALLREEPLAEEGHVLLMSCHAATGNRAAAIAQYQSLTRLLDEELGLTPGPDARELYLRLLE